MRFLFPLSSKISGNYIPTFQLANTATGEGISGMGFQRCRKKKEAVIVIMGATGTGKSKLSIEIAERFPAEIVNADKIQIYKGLDITTNKIPIPDRRGMPHHLLGNLDPAAGELSPAGFRSLAADAVTEIISRGRIPVIAGGSNSFIHAMMVSAYDPRLDLFGRDTRLRYRSCLLWVDVEAEVLAKQLDKRVDDMVGMGMVEELERYFEEGEWDRHVGLGKAIGVPEFAEYFRRRTEEAYEDAIEAIKENTRRLAEEQVRKIKRFGEMGWMLRRVDATKAVVARLGGAGEKEAWERDVLSPSLSFVEKFLEDED